MVVANTGNIIDHAFPLCLDLLYIGIELRLPTAPLANIIQYKDPLGIMVSFLRFPVYPLFCWVSSGFLVYNLCSNEDPET